MSAENCLMCQSIYAVSFKDRRCKYDHQKVKVSDSCPLFKRIDLNQFETINGMTGNEIRAKKLKELKKANERQKQLINFK